MRDLVELDLLACSDTLVLAALGKAYSRAIPRSARGRVRDIDRWAAYEHTPIPEDKMDAALSDAWSLCPILAGRHHLDVVVQDWQGLLDSYTRALMMMSVPHAIARLRDELLRVDRLPVFNEADESDEAWGILR